MVYSMTGYGCSEVLLEGRKVSIDVRTLNSKSLDVSVKLPLCYRDRELSVRRVLGERLLRGKVDCCIFVENICDTSGVTIDSALCQHYYSELTAINAMLPAPLELSWQVLLRLPNVVVSKEVNSVSDAEWDVVLAGVSRAIDGVTASRASEGAEVSVVFDSKLAAIRELLASLEPFEHGRVDAIRRKIIAQLEQLQPISYDKSRLEQEMIYYIEKLDVSEEKQRLVHHMDFFSAVLHSDDTVAKGKQLGFIAQEMGREINTLGSKSNEAAMQTIVVKMKDELEQIKEQVLNVL